MSAPPTEYRDEAGVVIPYGSRWTARRPPEDSYSRVSNPQRFEPLQGVARQFIAFLGREYEVEVATGPFFASEFSHPSGVGEVVRLAPAVPLTAPLTFGFTGLPASSLPSVLFTSSVSSTAAFGNGPLAMKSASVSSSALDRIPVWDQCATSSPAGSLPGSPPSHRRAAAGYPG